MHQYNVGYIPFVSIFFSLDLMKITLPKWVLHQVKQATNVISYTISKNFTSQYVDVVNNNFYGLLNYTSGSILFQNAIIYKWLYFCHKLYAFWGMTHAPESIELIELAIIFVLQYYWDWLWENALNVAL